VQASCLVSCSCSLPNCSNIIQKACCAPSLRLVYVGYCLLCKQVSCHTACSGNNLPRTPLLYLAC
jgi:hypothetical protein